MSAEATSPARRTVITGVGVVSAAGGSVEAGWQALVSREPAGRSWQPDDQGNEFFGAPLPDDYRAHPDVPRNLAHFLDRGSLIAIDAALQALADAGLGPGGGDSRRFAVADGLAYRAPGQPTLFVPYGHMVARTLGVRGPVLTLGGAEASGLAAVAAGARLIEQKQADVVFAGAAQAIQLPLMEHLRAQGFAARVPGRPFDESHNGFTAAEGAAYLVLESEDHARQRGATILAVLAGIGENFDSLVEPLAISGPQEAGRTQQDALAASGYLQNQVDFVVSCADGREAVDFADGYALERTFGRHAFFAGVTTVAGTLGHALAASGPISLAYAVEAIRRQHSFPITGFETPEKDLELAYATTARDERLDCVLVTSLGLGGTNVSLILTRPEPAN